MSSGDILAEKEMMAIQTHFLLTTPTFFILLMLAPGPQHGYAIMKETAVLSGGRVQLSTSTLYGAIKRLLDRGWIERSVAESGIENSRARKAYQLTDLGRRILNAETARLQSLVTMAQQAGAGVSP